MTASRTQPAPRIATDPSTGRPPTLPTRPVMFCRTSTPKALAIATVIAAAVLLTACEPIDDPAAGQSADRAARDISKDILADPGDPPLIVTRVYRKDDRRCFEARDFGPHDRFHRACARPSDPADVRAYIARQRVGKPVKD